MKYKLEISRKLRSLEERRYAAIVSLWFDTYLNTCEEVFEAEFIVKALSNQTSWMAQPFAMQFYQVDNLAMVMRDDGSLILSILVLTT